MAKLKRVVEYIRTTIFIPLVLGWDKTGNLVWSIDVSFAVHMDMKSHTGFGLSLGLGAVTSSSLKQKLTASSTTTSELYGIHDGMPMITWFRLFYMVQVKLIVDDGSIETKAIKRLGKASTILQDNTSTIQLAKNGKRSSSKRTRHVDIRYFYVSEEVEKENIQILYCPTKDQWSDFWTKSLQGILFQTHRNTIMGITAEQLVEFQRRYHEQKRIDR